MSELQLQKSDFSDFSQNFQRSNGFPCPCCKMHEKSKNLPKNHQKSESQKPRNSMDVWTWMRHVHSFPGSAIVYGVAPWVGWKESTVVGCVLIVYAHSPVPIVLAGKYFSRSAGRLRSTTRSDEKSELEKIENH